MKRILSLTVLIGAASFIALWATPGADHKVFWCHYPPGQWTGVPGDASHVIILSIDRAATDKTTAKHLGHSPLLGSGDPAEGESEDGTAAGCPSDQSCGTAEAFDELLQEMIDVQLDWVNGECVCPQGTGNAGSAPDPDCGAFG